MIISAALSPSVDVTYTVDELRLGRIHRPAEVFRMAGGKALNATRAAAIMGADVAAVAVLGGATGDVIAGALGTSGVRLIRVDSPTLTRTCTSIHSRATGELTEVYESAVEVTAAEFDRVAAELERAMDGRSGWLILSGGLPASLPADALPRLIDGAHARGFRVAVDTHGAALAAAAAARPDLVKVNREEAHELIGADDAPVGALAAALATRTGALVVITDGVDGAVASVASVPSVPSGAPGAQALRARLRDPVGEFPVGSGDSFLGGLVLSLDAGADLPDAMRMAAACGTANALVPGAARFERSTVEALLPEVELSDE